MPDGDRVGSAYVDIHVNAAPGEAELAAFKAKVDRDFAELDRKKAEAKVKLDAVEFDRTIDKVKTELDNLKRKKASVTIEADTKQLDADIAEAEAELKALTSKKRTIQIDSRQVKAAHDAERLLAKEQALTERQAIQSAKAERKLSNERDKAVTRTYKERAELAKLGQEYEKLRGRQIGLEKSSRRVFSAKSIGTADKEARRLEKVAAEADYVKHKIEKLGGSVDDLDPAIQRNHTLWGRWLSRLGDTSVRIGPITTSVKGLATGLGLLGPLVFELGGGLTALAGTVGESAAGAFTVGAGALAGFAASAAGVGFVIGPMIGEFKEVHSASEALYKAQLKYGKGSEQVKTAQERLNNELHGVSPIAKEAFESYGSLTSRWKNLTKAARPAVFNAFGQSLKTAQALLPAFASESVKTTQVAGKAWDGWMKSLRSSEAKGLLKSIMSDFRASIPGLADGLGSLVAMMGRLSAAGAHFLPGLSNGFADWANNLERAVGGGQKLQSNVGGMVDQMRDLGHLTQDTGSLLVHIFDAGSDSGQGMVKSLDGVIKKWDAINQTASGKANLRTFFGESKTATEDFMSSLGHLTKLLFEFSRATAPVANGLLQIVTWIGDLVSAADELVGVKTVFQGIGLALGALWVTSKAMAFVNVVQDATAALYGLAAGEEAVAAAQASGGLSGLLMGRGKGSAVATVGEDAAASAGQLELLGAEAGTAGTAMAGAAEGGGLLAAALAPEVLIPAAAIAGLAILVGNLGDVETAWDKTQNAFKESGRQIPRTLNQMAAQSIKYVETQHSITKATNAANAARERVVKLAKEGASPAQQTRAQIAYNQAIEQQAAAEKDLGRQNTISAKGAKQTLKVQEEHLDAAHEALKVAREQRASAVRQREIGFNGERPEDRAHALEKLRGVAFGVATAEGEVARARSLVAQASRQATVSGIPLERQIKHLGDIAPQTERGLHKLVETIGSAATKKIGSFVNPQDVAKVTNLGNQLSKLGRGGQVKDIAVKSSGADQTISKLQRLQKQTNKVENSRASIKIGANDQQAQKKLQRLGALSQKVTGARNTIKILANSSSAEQAIHRLRQNLETTARKKYKLEMTGVDRSGPAAASAYHHAREAASKKYEIRIGAIDNATSVAKKAEGSAKKAGQQHPKVNISATDNASSIIQGVAAKLQALNGQTAHTTVVNTTENITVTKHRNGATGGVFAAGGMPPSDRVIDRASRQASDDTRGRSRKVQTPRYLVGEEQGHPEYVIATNPAYRDSNERYLESAASDLGYSVVPAYKTGKGTKKKTSAGASGKKGPHGHPKKQKNSHFYLKHNKFSSQATEEYNTTEKDIDLKENLYNKEVEREEKEIEHGTLEEWNWPLLRGYLTDERNDYRHIGGLTKQIRQDTGKAISSASKKIKGLNGPIKSTRKQVSQIGGEYSAMRAPTKGDKTDAEYQDAKKHYAAAKRKKEAEKKAAENRLKKLEKEKENAINIRREAQEKLNEIGAHSGSIFEKENDIKEEEAQTDLTYFEGELKERTAPDESAAADLPSYGEQTATLSAEREKLFNEFGSNISGYYGPQAGTRTPLGANTAEYAPGGAASSYGAGSAAQTAATTGPGGYVTAATKRYAGGLPTNAYSTGAGAHDSMGTVNNVTNNFAAPPPDPHTWAKQQTFELGALAG